MSNYTKHSVEIELGGRTLKIETGHWAKQADAAVVVTYGETIVLGTAVRAAPRPGIDFFPLTVDYREKTYAAGKFLGGFRKREGQPNQKETLTMRNIDRPLRPLFPKGFLDEVQIQTMVLCYDGQNEPDVLAGIAASAALTLSSIPFEGPIGNVRVARVDGQFVVMPTVAQDAYSDLDLLLCGTRTGVNMIEVGAYEVPEADMHEAVKFGFGHIQRIVEAIAQLQKKCGKAKTFDLHLPPAEIKAEVSKKLAPEILKAKTTPGAKHERAERVKAAKKAFFEAAFPAPADSATPKEVAAYADRVKWAKMAAEEVEEEVTRDVIRSGTRTDGRKSDELRAIECLVDVLPNRVHGSALFTRGETQALLTVTLGTGKDEQIVDGLGTEYAEKFYLHYNFPPFSVGEAKRIAAPGRREIGHGKLAERALVAVLPAVEDFPYTVRLVSEILESNGSSSMASACGGTLALMAAGVPITAPVAGISIGLISADKAGQKEVYLTDIQGEEDHFGDMDFKVCGTRTGITAIQVDLKVKELTIEQVGLAFELARKNRLQILDLIEAAIPEPRAAISPYAPRILSTKIHPDKIGKLIGPGGKTIRGLEEQTGAKIEVEEDGTIHVSAVGEGKAEVALAAIEALCSEVKVGTIYTGKVVSIKEFGCFVEIAPGQDGMCHVSELSDGFVGRVTDVVQVGDIVKVKVLLVDETGRVKLSRKAAMKDEGMEESPEVKERLAKARDQRDAHRGERHRGDGERRHPSRDQQPRREAAPAAEASATAVAEAAEGDEAEGDAPEGAEGTEGSNGEGGERRRRRRRGGRGRRPEGGGSEGGGSEGGAAPAGE